MKKVFLQIAMSNRVSDNAKIGLIYDTMNTKILILDDTDLEYIDAVLVVHEDSGEATFIQTKIYDGPEFTKLVDIESIKLK